MSATKRKIIDKISRKNKEIQELEEKLLMARAELKTMEEVLKLFPREGEDETTTIRPGSQAGKAQKVLAKHGRPMHVGDILLGMKKANNKKNRASLAGILASYYRRGEVFSRPAPNTFGLLTWGDNQPLPDVIEEIEQEEPESTKPPLFDKHKLRGIQ